METNNKPVELDKNIVYKNSEKNTITKKTKLPWIYIVGIVGFLLFVGLLFFNPENGTFIEFPPPGEQAERDSIFAVAARIEQFSENRDSLPARDDIQIPDNITYEKESELSWTLETETGLFYSSDMDINAFKVGEL